MRRPPITMREPDHKWPSHEPIRCARNWVEWTLTEMQHTSKSTMIWIAEWCYEHKNNTSD
jgi:hypothetical protein